MAGDTAQSQFGQAHLLGWMPTLSPEGPFFDPLTTTASDLARLLSAGKVSSVQILNDYYRQILKYNGYLKAVLQLAPGAVNQARARDAQRARGELLGPLHGIPILLKDNIGTEPSMGMPTTGCNISLVDSYTTHNAPVVDNLIQAGAIIMGKVTLSEMMFFKGTGIRCGWSSLHGQSQNPYIKGGIDPEDGLCGHSSPGGSSSGSGIAVAAGMAPVAIGTETEGSLICPATRQGLWTIKPKLGTISNAGIMPISIYFDVPGPMCKTVEDTVNLLDALRSPETESSLLKAVKGAEGWKDLRIGALAPEAFRFDDVMLVPVPEAREQMDTATLRAYQRMQTLAAAYHSNIELPPLSEFEIEGRNSVSTLMVADFEKDFDEYIAGTTGSDIRSAKALAAWNRSHADVALPPEYPNQKHIERAIAFDKDPGKRQRILEHVIGVGKRFTEALKKYDINVIIGPADGFFSIFSAATGYPLCSLPLGCIDYNGRPVGLVAIAQDEHTLVTLMSAFEASFPPCELPSAFLDHEDPVGSH